MAEASRIVRIAATDIDGSFSVLRGLRKIHGINWMTGRAICLISGIDMKKKLGELSGDELKNLETAVKSQADSPTLPKWMLNRRKDFETGKDFHIIGSNLEFRQKEDINFQKRIRSRRGIRHELGLPVRGQRTKSTGRKARTVGVSRKKEAPAAKPAAPAAPKAAPAAKPAAPAKK